MPDCFARRLLIPFAGALLVCVSLFLLSGFPLCLSLMCCGYGMDFPFLCLGILFSLFNIIFFCLSSMHKQGDEFSFLAAPRGRFQHLSSLVFSDYFRGRFLVSLLFSMMLVLLGAALLFSLSLSSSWSALALGGLSVLGGLLFIPCSLMKPDLQRHGCGGARPGSGRR